MNLQLVGKSFALLTALIIISCTNRTQLPDDPNTEANVNAATKPGQPKKGEKIEFYVPPPATEDTSAEANKIMENYKKIDPQHEVTAKHLRAALLYYHHNASKITNKKYLGVIDYSLKPFEKRLWVMNMETGNVWAMQVAHGSGSGPKEGVIKFSNSQDSNASSVGFFLTGNTYTGGNGYSRILKGLSETNSMAEERNVVIHGADYVQDSNNTNPGRSWGCPAVSLANTKRLIDTLDAGTLLYAGYK